MKKVQLYVACLFVLSMLVLPCSAFAFFGAEIGVGYWQQSPSGGFSYQAIDPVTDRLDLNNDLYYSKQNKPYIRAKVELPVFLPNIYFMATPMTFEGSGLISRNIKFGSETFAAGVTIDSKLKLDHYDLALYYPIPLLKGVTFNTLSIELGLNARKLDWSATLNQPGTPSVNKDVSLYIPMIYAGVIVKPIDLLSIELETRWTSYNSSHYYDYIGRLKVHPIALVYIGAGYRLEDIKINEKDVLADMKFKGPFVEVGVTF